jgi:ketose-bisphosphate aldolase
MMNFKQIKARYDDCLKQKYALGAFNFSTSDAAKAILLGARNVQAPFLLTTSPGEMNHLSPEIARGIADGLDKMRKGVILHLDHGKTYEDIVTAVKAGYDSLHCDGSALPHDENIKLTKKAANLAHKRNLWIEGEIGHIGGSSTLHKDETTEKIEMVMTDPDEAKDFVEKTGVNSLAVNIGNVHGIWKGGKHIDLQRLADIHAKVKVPLVLHGGSDITAEQIAKAITLGIAKINVNTELRIAYTSAVRTALKDENEFVPTKYLPAAQQAVQAVVEEKLKMFGAAGKF